MSRKTFDICELVLFQREPGSRWELGEYLGADVSQDVHGWHYVRDDTGFHVRHYVPTRRIKKTVTAPSRRR